MNKVSFVSIAVAAAFGLAILAPVAANAADNSVDTTVSVEVTSGPLQLSADGTVIDNRGAGLTPVVTTVTSPDGTVTVSAV